MDGTSLTVCEVNRTEGWFTFMLIAYTQKHIIVPHKAVGDRYESTLLLLFRTLCHQRLKFKYPSRVLLYMR